MFSGMLSFHLLWAFRWVMYRVREVAHAETYRIHKEVGRLFSGLGLCATRVYSQRVVSAKVINLWCGVLLSLN